MTTTKPITAFKLGLENADLRREGGRQLTIIMRAERQLAIANQRLDEIRKRREEIESLPLAD